MTQDEIAAMQADALAGTPGEWELDYEKGDKYYTFISTKGFGWTYFARVVTAIDRAAGPAPSIAGEANARRIARLPRLETAVTALTAELATERQARIGLWDNYKALAEQAEADQIKIEAQEAEIERLLEAMSIAGPIALEDYSGNTRCYNEDEVRKIALIRELLGVQP